MLKIILVISIAILTALSAKASEAGKAFKHGTEQLQKGHYTAAIHTLDSLRTSGPRTPALYCNLGTAYYKTGQYGLAVLNYERGLRLSPFNKQLIHNLALLNGHINLTYAGNNNGSFMYWLAYNSILPLLLAILLCSTFSALSSFSVVSQLNIGFKRIGKVCLWVLIPALAVSSVFIIYNNNIRQGVAIHIYTARAAPAATSKVAFSIREGEKASIINYFEGWYKIKASNDRRGWVYCSGFKEID